MFCNLHGRPQKLSVKPPSSRNQTLRVNTNKFSTKVFSNTTKDFSRCSPDDVKMFSSSKSATTQVVSEILSDVIENIVQRKSDDTASPSSSNDATENKVQNESDGDDVASSRSNHAGLHESLISLDNSDITNTLGEPIPDEKTSQDSLNC